VRMGDFDIAFDSVAGLAAKLRSGRISSMAIVERLLERIDTLDKRLHSFISVCPERALASARAADVALKTGQDLGLLHGIPYAAKDLFDVEGMATTGGTRLRKDHRAKADCTAVKKLTLAGMALLGKTHTIQFAYGVVGINHDQGTPLNPWQSIPHVPGGSSSGSAVAVASGLIPVALGTDTGGSVRIPAALCGIVGLKTTVGRISRADVYPLSTTLDSVGVLTRSVEDAALVYHALQGADQGDPSTLPVESHDCLKEIRRGVKGLRIAFAETVFFDQVDPEVESAIRSTAEVFGSLGANVVKAAVAEVADAQADRARHMLIPYEGCAVNRDLLDHHFAELDPVVASRIVLGRSFSTEDYAALLDRRARLQGRVQATLANIDALLVPTCMISAAPLATIDESQDTYNSFNGKYNRNAGLGNYLNLCAVSVPCGTTSAGLPIGLMIYCKPFQENVALRVAYAYEQATDWHLRRPDLAWARTTPNRGMQPTHNARG
jgi:aspartyl-tRNA(Asn)/glutamyl-tRNA(Gln) amidotransferase subunit A